MLPRLYKKKNAKKGFTLIELLVVIAIIGVLASIVLASLNSARRKSRDARRIADIKQLQLADELFFDATQYYADSLSSLAPLYIPSTPQDPSTPNGYEYDNLTTQGAACIGSGNSCVNYVLGAGLEEGSNAALRGDADVCVASGCARQFSGPLGNGGAVGANWRGEDGNAGTSPLATVRCSIATGTNTSYCYDVTP